MRVSGKSPQAPAPRLQSRAFRLGFPQALSLRGPTAPSSLGEHHVTTGPGRQLPDRRLPAVSWVHGGPGPPSCTRSLRFDFSDRCLPGAALLKKGCRRYRQMSGGKQSLCGISFLPEVTSESVQVDIWMSDISPGEASSLVQGQACLPGSCSRTADPALS